METITIDFTGAKNWDEVHERISKPLDFPEWYGKNLDALWDLLTGYIAPCNIIIKGTKKFPANIWSMYNVSVMYF